VVTVLLAEAVAKEAVKAMEQDAPMVEVTAS